MSALLPRVLGMGCYLTRPGTEPELSSYDWHDHVIDEVLLVTDSATTIGHGGEQSRAEPNTVFLHRRGERHGYWNGPSDAPRTWVVHYQPEEAFYDQCPQLADPDPRSRVWHLTTGQTSELKDLFLKTFAEHRDSRAGSPAAESAWLRLLLVAMARFADGNETGMQPKISDEELASLWRVVNDYAIAPAALGATLGRFPNYDSLRHRFRKIYGASPRAMAMSLRIERAKSLLLETKLSVKEVAERLGYARQHEFSRTFNQHVGCPPSEWRDKPMRDA